MVDHLHLQNDINFMTLWADSLSISLNISKCHTMTYSIICNSLVFYYLIDGVNITSSKNEVVDLGFIFDSKLCFRLYINNISCKALKLLGIVKCVCIDLKLSSSILSLYCSVLVYGTVVWGAINITDKCLLEYGSRNSLDSVLIPEKISVHHMITLLFFMI